jgi:hypothetical protein
MSDSAGSAPGGDGAPPPKVVYVMGAGRSGSTILGVALGNCAGVFYAGELDKWLMRSGFSPLGGEERAAFWERVRLLVDGSDMFGFQARSLERSSALFSPRHLRARRRLRARYRRVAADLFTAVARSAGASHVVDSSHYPLRARELQAVRGIELYLVFLVRDPQAVVASFNRDDVVERRFNTSTANVYLWLTHLLATFVYLRHPRERRMVVKHEDLLADPPGILRAMLDRVGSAAPLPDLGALHTGIPFQGNRLVRSPVVALDGPARAPARRSRLTAIAQLPWTLAFSHVALSARPSEQAAIAIGASARLRSDE